MSIIHIVQNDVCLTGHLYLHWSQGGCDTANKAPLTNCSVDHCDLPFVRRRQWAASAAWEPGNLNQPEEALKAPWKQTAEPGHFPSSWKTISSLV